MTEHYFDGPTEHEFVTMANDAARKAKLCEGCPGFIPALRVAARYAVIEERTRNNPDERFRYANLRENVSRALARDFDLIGRLSASQGCPGAVPENDHTEPKKTTKYECGLEVLRDNILDSALNKDDMTIDLGELVAQFGPELA